MLYKWGYKNIPLFIGKYELLTLGYITRLVYIHVLNLSKCMGDAVHYYAVVFNNLRY